MEESATQQDASVHDKIMAKLSQDAPATQDEEETEAQAEVEESEPEDSEVAQEESEAEEDDGQEVEDPQAEVELSDIAQFLGVEPDVLDVDEDGQVVFKTKVDGQQGSAKVKDFLESYQLKGHLNNQNMEVKKLQDELQQKQSELEEKSQQKLQEAENVIQLAAQELQADYQNVNWEELKQDDPSEYAAKKMEFQERQQRLSQAYQQLESQRGQSLQESQAQIQQHLRQEDQKLMEKIEGWSDMEKASKEIKDVYKYMADGIGFNPSEIYHKFDNNGNIERLGVADHRIVMMARKAMLYDQLQSNKSEVTKKVKKAPKLVKPGQPQSKEKQQTRKLQDLKARIKKTDGKGGSVKDYLLAAGKV